MSRVHVSRWSGGWWIDGFAGLEAKARREGKGGAGGRQQKRGEEEEARKEGRRRESRIDSGKLGAVWLRRHVSCSRSFHKEEHCWQNNTGDGIWRRAEGVKGHFLFNVAGIF